MFSFPSTRHVFPFPACGLSLETLTSHVTWVVKSNPFPVDSWTLWYIRYLESTIDGIFTYCGIECSTVHLQRITLQKIIIGLFTSITDSWHHCRLTKFRFILMCDVSKDDWSFSACDILCWHVPTVMSGIVERIAGFMYIFIDAQLNKLISFQKRIFCLWAMWGYS